MHSSLKVVVCVVFICATAVSANEREKRDVIDLRPILPYQWQSANNNWGIRNLNDINQSGLNTLRINGGNDQERQWGISQQSELGNNEEQSQLQENAEIQDSNGGWGLQRENNNLGLRGYSSVSSQERGQWNLGQNNGQRQSQLSEELGALGGLNSQIRGNINAGQGIGIKQNLQGQGRLLGENIQSNQRNEVNNRINLGLLERQRSSQIRGNILKQRLNGNLQNNEWEQGLQGNTQEGGINGLTLESLLSAGQGEALLQSQRGRNSNQQRSNQLGEIQGELRGDINGRQQLRNNGWNRQRWSSGRNWGRNNIGQRQEGLEQGNQESRINGETLNLNQGQREENQINGAQQQQPNIYTYGELSARILKVIQSNPAMLSNMNGLMEELQNEGDSGNQQVRQLKSLLQQVGKINGNQSRNEGQGQQNSLVRNLLDIMERSLNNENEQNVPTSYQSFSRW